MEQLDGFVKLQILARRAIVPPSVKVKEGFGGNLERLRTDAGFKQSQELAKKLGVKPSVVSRWENNRTGPPNTRTLFKLAKTLNCSIEALLVNVDGDYDKQLRAQQGATPEGPRINVATQDRIQKLETLVTEYQATLGEVRNVAKRLTRIAAFGGKGRAPRRDQRKSG